MEVTFKIEYRTEWGESLSLVIKDKKHPMSWGDGAIWSVTVPDLKVSDLSDYSYIVMKEGMIWRTEWKHHSTKAESSCKSLEIKDKWLDCPIPGCPFPREHQAAMFDRPGFMAAGVAIPVFSLRSTSSFGIGEFNDLKPLIDWAAGNGMSVIQILPVNDTTRRGKWTDSYPYSPVSSFALHPMYINLNDVGIKADKDFIAQREAVNALPELDYPLIATKKKTLLRKAFDANGEKDMASPAFAKFCKQNSFWLDEYSEFCSKRDRNKKEYYMWIQYHLDKQFGKVADYARSKGIALKGDLPIGVSQDSAEAYWHPELFNLDSSAGAPPDFFSADGQNWGFPTYNWEEMSKNDYAWWKARLRKMSRYFDAFRIDHILGFFRIWEIPATEKSGMKGHFNPTIPYSREEINNMQLPIEGLFLPDPRHEGCFVPCISPDKSKLEWWQNDRFSALYNDYFFHRHDEFWRVNAEKKLPELLSATGMLACGEDLGMVPDCVPGVMDHEKILSLEMAQMDKGRNWPYLSVCATSSHDMSTLRMQSVEAGKGDPEPEEVERILRAHLSSASMLAIFPLQDWVALDKKIRRKDFMEERVNHPEDPNHHWRYRFHLDVASLKGCSDLNRKISSMLQEYGRHKDQNL